MRKIFFYIFLLVIWVLYLSQAFSYTISWDMQNKIDNISKSITTSKKAKNLSFALRYKTINRVDLTTKQKVILNYIQKSLYDRYEELSKLEEDKISVNIYAWWDVMISRFVWFLAQKKWRDYLIWEKNPIDWLQDWITFFNLESPFSTVSKDTDKVTWTFWANINWISFLQKIIWETNSGVLSIANNHSLDSLKEWYDLTKNILIQNNISYIWDKENDFVIINKKWKNICFDWYAYSGDGSIYKKIDENNILSSIKLMKKSSCDAIIISLHWWEEYKFNPTDKQKDLAKKIIDNWADLILWHHSHIPWKIEFYKNKPIIYSLWNYVFDQNFWMDECEIGQDCIFDDKMQKNVLPTFVATLKNIQIDFVWEYKIINIIDSRKFKINYWKFEDL